jgi:hypothetical protein
MTRTEDSTYYLYYRNGNAEGVIQRDHIVRGDETLCDHP